MQVDGDLSEPETREVLGDVADERPAHERYRGFRAVNGQRPEARAVARGQNHRTHPTLRASLPFCVPAKSYLELNTVERARGKPSRKHLREAACGFGAWLKCRRQQKCHSRSRVQRLRLVRLRA